MDDEGRIHHHALRGHRVGRNSLDGQFGVSRIEGFPDHFSELAAVDRIGPVDRELREVELSRALFAELLVRNEADVDVAVGTIFTDHDVERRHDVRDGRLVVGAQNGRPVRNNDVVALIALDFRMLGRTEPDVLFRIQQNVASLVIPDDMRMNVGRETDVDRIHMHDPADRRNLLSFRKIRGQLRGHNRIGRNLNILKSEGAEFPREQFGKHALALRARDRSGLQAALGRNCGITEEALKKFLARLGRHNGLL